MTFTLGSSIMQFIHQIESQVIEGKPMVSKLNSFIETIMPKIILLLLLGSSNCFSHYLNSNQFGGIESGWEHVFAYNISSVIPLNNYGSKSYYLGIQVRATYMQSMQFCENIHMKLLTIRSLEENDRIQKYIREASKGSEDFWTSGSKLLDGRNWVWMSHGDAVQYTNWAPGEPNDDQSQCLHLSAKSGRLYWYDCRCDSRNFFICERSRVPEKTTFADTETTVTASDVILNLAPTTDWMKMLSSASPSIGLLQYKNKRYFLPKSLKTTYLTAIQFCKIINMDLVTIASEEENDRIYKYIRDINGGQNWWTSGTKLLDGKSWIWLTKGSAVEYTNWLKGQPDGDDEFCLQMVHQKDKGLFWRDSRCSEAYHIICETTCSDDNKYCGDGGINNIGESNIRETFVKPKSFTTTSTMPSPVDEEESMNEEEWQYKIRMSPPGSISIAYVEGLKYHMEVDLVATKSQAEIYCDYHHMKLVSILNEDENNRLKHLMTDSSVPGPFWTSSRRIDGVWTWPSQSQQFYSNWASGKPSSESSDKNCMGINHLGEWLDESCFKRRHFICEMPSPVIDIRRLTDDQQISRKSQCSSEPIVNVYISNNVITEDGKNEVSQRFLSSKDVEYSDTGYHVHVKNIIETPGSEKNNELM